MFRDIDQNIGERLWIESGCLIYSIRTLRFFICISASVKYYYIKKEKNFKLSNDKHFLSSHFFSLSINDVTFSKNKIYELEQSF